LQVLQLACAVIQLSNVIQCYPSGEGQYQGAAKPGEELVMDCRVEKAGVLDGFESIESI